MRNNHFDIRSATTQAQICSNSNYSLISVVLILGLVLIPMLVLVLMLTLCSTIAVFLLYAPKIYNK